ncbi:hypothetical protein SDC9_195238 [bioreactor metagenome]|uniref:Uncharacterized protein n=1 Tax=bioreactor metagenome TaxID=1076179 RepID=A0A645I8G2_9ZZZZ
MAKGGTAPGDHESPAIGVRARSDIPLGKRNILVDAADEGVLQLDWIHETNSCDGGSAMADSPRHVPCRIPAGYVC